MVAEKKIKKNQFILDHSLMWLIGVPANVRFYPHLHAFTRGVLCRSRRVLRHAPQIDSYAADAPIAANFRECPLLLRYATPRVCGHACTTQTHACTRMHSLTPTHMPAYTRYFLPVSAHKKIPPRNCGVPAVLRPL